MSCYSDGKSCMKKGPHCDNNKKKNISMVICDTEIWKTVDQVIVAIVYNGKFKIIPSFVVKLRY